MPRSNGVYSPPSGTNGVPLTPISSAAYNGFVADIAADQNNPRPIIAGGTGGATAGDARTNLGLGNAATRSVGTTAGTVAAGDDSRITGALQKAGGIMSGDIDMDGKKIIDADWSDEVASAADVRAGAAGKWVTADANHAAMAWQPLTDAATIAVDHAAGINRTVTITDDRQFGAPSNAIPGLPLNILIEQDGSGGHAPTWHANYKFGDYGVPLLSTGAGHADLLTFVCLAADKFIFMGIRRRVD